ncbi:MAG: DNA-protecting protein DprA [Spirochaetaceae bacterium]|jgi:DNA processing protein|nr:DNA-protecting protein DprA [Spirochaetaceae bacterium]
MRVFLTGRFDCESEFTCLSPAEIEEICAEEAEIKGRGEKAEGKGISARRRKLAKNSSRLLFEDEAGRWNMKDVVSQAQKDAAFMESRGIRWVSIVEDVYPSLLREIYDPPAVLFYRGELPPPAADSVAIVGTRKAGAAALRWAYTTAKDLSKAGVVVVSGLALGIDAMAHRGCVDAASAVDGGGFYSGGGVETGVAPAAAVLGSSVDEVYPASNRALARRIVGSGGVLLSEYPPGTLPAKWRFPARNRIISGLCKCAVVVEAGEKSGALITASFALEQGRDLFVAGRAGGGAAEGGAGGDAGGGFYSEGGATGGGSAEESAGRDAACAFGAGARRLAEEGAKVVYNSGDILAELTGRN